MQVVSHFTFTDHAEYSKFCRHMAQFNPDAAPGKGAPDKDIADSPKAQTKSEPKAEAPAKADTPKAKTPETHAVTKASKDEKKVDKSTSTTKKLATEPTYENMKEAILAVANTYKSKAKAFEILKKYGIEKITPDVPDEHFADIIADCQKAIDAHG